MVDTISKAVGFNCLFFAGVSLGRDAWLFMVIGLIFAFILIPGKE